MNDHTIIWLAGLYCIGFAVFHIQFPRLFDWKNELPKLSSINRAILQIANRRLIYFFVFAAAICFIFTDELATTPLGQFFLGGMSFFWLGRTIEQFIYLRIDHPMAHLLTYLFIIGAILFAIPVVM